MQVSKFEPTEVRMTDGWFVRLQPQAWSDTIQIWIGKTTPTGNFLLYFDEKGRLTEKKIKEPESDVLPTMQINRMIWDGMSRALQGVAQPPEQGHLEGELEATKYHLEDLREMLKLKKL